jgi:hypothetical protein
MKRKNKIIGIFLSEAIEYWSIFSRIRHRGCSALEPEIS